jgi:mono/diheme cytochrome c family protein
MLPNRSLYFATVLWAVALLGTGAAVAQGAKGAADADGAHVYRQARCFACHGGYGFGGAGPRFRQNRFVAMDDYVIGQILIGRDIMPSFADTLNDRQIAAVATFIRTSWGNNFGPVKPDEVARVRGKVKLNPPDQPHLPPPTPHGK